MREGVRDYPTMKSHSGPVPEGCAGRDAGVLSHRRQHRSTASPPCQWVGVMRRSFPVSRTVQGGSRAAAPAGSGGERARWRGIRLSGGMNTSGGVEGKASRSSGGASNGGGDANSGLGPSAHPSTCALTVVGGVARAQEPWPQRRGARGGSRAGRPRSLTPESSTTGWSSNEGGVQPRRTYQWHARELVIGQSSAR